MRESVKLIVFVFSVIVSVNVFTQSSTINGKVVDQKTGETLIGATVLLEGTTKGAITDFDGNYMLTNIQPGKYNIICQFVSYETQRIADVMLIEGQKFEANFVLGEALTQLDEVKVVARKRRELEQLLLAERKEATVAVESIGAQELSRKGVGNVASGVKKIAGISMIGRKQLFVRGLADRYNSVQLNGLPIASPDPVRKVIKLDIFPTEIVEAISVSKVLNVKNYADYTGALINIETKAYSITPFFKIDLGLGYNTVSTGKDFKQMETLGTPYFGLNLSDRRSSVPTESKTYDLSDTYYSDIFKAGMSYINSTAMPNQEFAISAGKLFNIGNKQLGVLVSSTFENESQVLSNASEVVLRTDGTNQSRFQKNAYMYHTNLSNLLSVSYRHNVNNSITYNFLFLCSTVDNLSEKNGRTYDIPVFVRYGEFTSHSLINNQVFGKHSLNDKWKLDWRVGYALASSERPDTRQLVLNSENAPDYYYETLNAQETMRTVDKLEENELSGKLGLEYKLSESSKLVFGGQYRYKTRDYNAHLYYYNVRGIADFSTTREDAHQLLNNQNFADTSIFIKNGSIWSNKYDASINIAAAYASYVFTLNTITLDVGLRTEISNMFINPWTDGGYAADPVKLPENDFLPSLNFKLKTTENSNFRIALSRTITRPSFNEKSPSKLVPEFGKALEHGNPELVNSYSNNADVKYEVFPRPNELYSIGFYAKSISNPIERVARKSGGTNIYTYDNTEEGIATGAEVEIKKRFNNLYTGFNAAIIHTQLTISEDANETNKERALQGASPYLVNADLGYVFNLGSDDKHTSSFAFVYNVYGKRIWAVGADGIGDSYELPFHTLNFIWKNRINNKLDINFKVSNILNQPVEIEQDWYQNGEIAGRKKIYSIKTGTEYKISIGYKF